MYKLYTRPGSGGFVAEAALLLAGEPFEQIDVAKTDNPDAAFLAISPLNQVPVLTLPDGHTMTESAAICMALAERHPEAALAPQAGAPARADFLRWMAFMSSAIYPAVLRFYYAHRYSADDGAKAGVRKAAVAELDRDLAILDKALVGREWLIGERMTIADVYLLMLFSWHPEMERAKKAFANVERFCTGLRDHPVLEKLNASHEMW